MIRKLRKADINKVADIWLDTNIKAHYFIPAQYWKRNFDLVKELLLQATVYVYEDKQEIQGFEIQCNGIDEATGERDYVMAWQRKRQRFLSA